MASAYQLVAMLSLALSQVNVGQARTPRAPKAPASDEYDLRVRVNSSTRQMSVSGLLRLRGSAGRDSLRLVLWSEAKDVRFELVSPSGNLSVTTDSADGDRSWYLRSAPSPGRDVAPVVRFSYRLDSADAPQLRVWPASTVAGGGGELWYPRPGFDSLGTGVITVQVSPGETVVATGERIASQSASSSGEFKFRVSQPSHFALAVGRFHVTRAPGSPGVALYSLTTRPGDAEAAARAVRLLEVLCGAFGSLPVREYAIAEVEFGGAVAGTSEGGLFFADRSQLDAGFSVPFFAHEISHAWWGGLIRSIPGTAGRMMLSEGLAQYGMLLALERMEGATAAERFRRGAYPGHTLGRSPADYFRLSAAGLELPLTAFVPETRQVLALHQMANTRGPVLLQMLERVMGPRAFHRVLRQFVHAHRGTAVSWAQLESAINRSHRQGYAWFFGAWFAATGAPEYVLTYRTTRQGVSGVVRHHPPVYGAMVQVEARGEGRRAERWVMVRDSSVSFTWQLPFHVDTLMLDPHQRTLRWHPALREWATAFAGYTKADWQRRFGTRAAALVAFGSALNEIGADDSLGVEFMLRLGLARTLGSDAPREARTELERALRLPVRPAEQLPFAYLELARRAAQKGDTVALRHAVAATIDAERVSGVRLGAAFEATMLLDGRR